MSNIVQHARCFDTLLQETLHKFLQLSTFSLTFLQVANCLIVVLQLQVTLAQEEVSLYRLAVQLQRMFTVRQGLVMLLQLHMAQSPVGVVHCHGWITILGDGTKQALTYVQ